MKLTRILSFICALYLAFVLSYPAYSIKEAAPAEITTVKTIKEGSISDMAKENIVQKLQSRMNSSLQTRIDREILELEGGFDAFPEEARIDLTLKDVDVASILRIVAKEGGMNIVIDESVMGFISAELKDISLNEAMQTILVSEELEARVSNNTIFVASRPVMAKRGLNRRFIKTFKLNNSDAVYISDILRASIFNKGYKVKQDDAVGGSALAALPAAPGIAQTEEEGSSTGKSDLINSKIIKGKVETLQASEGFGNAGELASNIKIQHAVAKTGDIQVDNNDGGAIVIPDTRTNSILVAGLKKDILLAEEAIKYLDKPLRQVAIEVSLLELKKDDSKDLGISANMQGGKTSGGFNTPASTFTGLSEFASSANQSGIMLNTVGSLADEVAVKLNAMIYNEEAKLLANPTIVALSGSESIIKITEQIVNKVDTTISDGVTTYSVDLADVGIVLNILPKIGDDNSITMRIRPSITNSLPIQTIGSVGGTNIEITPISTREVILQDVRVKSGDTLSIAGLLKEKDTDKVGKVPLFGSIPVIGRLFSNTEFDHEKTELIILITPTIIEDIASL